MSGEGQVPSKDRAGPASISLEEALATTRAMRRLEPDPVPLDVLARVVEAATMAPTGSYAENWRFFVVTDREIIGRLGELWGQLHGMVEEHARSVLPDAIFRSVVYLGRHFGDSPAVVFVGGTGAPPPGAPLPMTATWYGSLFPAVQNLMLAARSFGLGTTLTTLVLAFHDQVRELLGAPEDVTLVACIPVGYPKGRFARPARRPVSEVAYLNRHGNPLPDPGPDPGSDVSGGPAPPSPGLGE